MLAPAFATCLLTRSLHLLAAVVSNNVCMCMHGFAYLYRSFSSWRRLEHSDDALTEEPLRSGKVHLVLRIQVALAKAVVHVDAYRSLLLEKVRKHTYGRIAVRREPNTDAGPSGDAPPRPVMRQRSLRSKSDGSGKCSTRTAMFLRPTPCRSCLFAGTPTVRKPRHLGEREHAPP